MSQIGTGLPPTGATPSDKPKLYRSVRDEERDTPHPLYAVWEITLACDLGCKHCGSRAGPARDTELSTQQCLDVVREMQEMGIREVTLIGGEAYLREDWDVIAAEITRRGMACGITTGARNFDADRLKRAEAAGVRSISVSLDGLQASHDIQRGSPGSWAAALDAARRIAASRIRLTVNTQVNRLSLPEVPAVASLLAELGARAWQIQITVPMGRAADRPDLLLQPEDLLDFYPLLVWVKQERLDPHGIGLFPGNNIGYFGPYEQDLRYGGDEGAHWAACAAGKWSIGLEADGKIKGCPSLPSDQYTGGYLGRDQLAEVIQSSPEVAHIRQRTAADLWGYCGDCYYNEVCLGGCNWTAHCLLGKPGNNPYCIHRALDFESQGLRERLVLAEPAPGEPFDHGRFDLLVEPLPEARPAEVAGHPLERVAALRWDEPSIWTEAQRRHLTRRVGRLVQVD